MKITLGYSLGLLVTALLASTAAAEDAPVTYTTSGTGMYGAHFGPDGLTQNGSQTYTNAAGAEYQHNTVRNFQAGENGVNYDRTGNGTGPRGGTTNSAATGTATRTDTGYNWQQSGGGSNSFGNSWTTDASGSVSHTANGAVRNQTATITSQSGQSAIVNHTGTVVKNDDGTRTYSGNGTVTGPKGNESQFTNETIIRRNSAGNFDWTGTRTATGPGGMQATGTTVGTATASADGLKWNADRTGTGPNGNIFGSTADGTVTPNGSGGYNSQVDRTRMTGRGAVRSSSTQGSYARSANTISHTNTHAAYSHRGRR